MNIAFIGKHIYPKDIFSNEQDMKTWRSMAAYFGGLFIIAQSPDLFFHYAREKNIRVYLVPRLFGYFGFVAFAAKLGFFLNLKYGIDVFDASEVAGGGMAVTFLKFLTGRLSVIEVQGEIFRASADANNTNTRMNANDTNRSVSKIRGIRMRFVDSYYYYKSRLLQKIGKWAMRHAARVRVISRAIYDQVLERGVDERKIRLVSLRVDTDDFNPDKFKSSENRSLTVGYVGRLVDGKGLEDLLEAVSKLKLQDLKFKVLIFGSGPFEQKLKKMSQELGISDLVEWRGFAPYSKVPEALAEIDIFVYPSWHEGFGRSIMEALAMEKAVVATNIGGIPDLVRDGENGFLVEPHNPDQLAEKIKILIGDKNLREQFGKAGRAWVAKNYEWNDGIKKFADLFLELNN